MYKIAFLSLMIFNTTTLKIKDVVQEYHNIKNKSEEQKFIKKYRKNTSVDIIGYVYSLEMKQAEYFLNPFKKLSIFNTYSSKLNKAISSNPNNIHLRYIRLVIQEKTPSFLGYNKNIENDKKLLLSSMNKKDKYDFLDKYIKLNTSL